MSGRPLTILQLTHQGGGSGSTVAIANLSRQLARRGHRVLIGCRPGTTLPGPTADAGLELWPLVFRRLRPLAPALGGHRVVPSGIACGRVDAPPSAADVATARAAPGGLGGRRVVLVLARRKDQDILLAGLGAFERPVVVACVGIEADDQLRAIERSVPERHRVVYVPFTDRPL